MKREMRLRACKALNSALLAGVAVLAMYSAPARAQFASVINLSSLDGTSGFRLDGTASSNAAGFSTASAGDVNGDGFADLIVGAFYASPGGNAFAGSSYVVFGKGGAHASATNLSSLDGTNGFRLDGFAAIDLSGATVASAGDVNGDGFSDLIIAAPLADPGGNDGAGSSFVVFGKASGFAPNISLSTLNGANGFRLDGVHAGDNSGASVSSAGDVNGDGFADVIIGAPLADVGLADRAGSGYVVFGKAGGFASVMNLFGLNGSNGFRVDGASSIDYAGTAVSSAGDVNGDGFADIILGARGADPKGPRLGASYVVFGKAGGFASAIGVAGLDGHTGFRFDGGAAFGNFGNAVSSAGDVNGDGFADLMVGAYAEAPNGHLEAGSTYVVFGKSGGFPSALDPSSLNGATGLRLDGSASGDHSGIAVASAGDVNGDGFSDLIVGADVADPNANIESGSSYVVFGRAGGFTSVIDLSALDGGNGFRLDGVASLDQSGRSVSGSGDLNGDGFADLVVGAFGADPNGLSAAGSSYVVFGRAPGVAVLRESTRARQIIQGGPFGDVLVAADAGDVLEGRAGGDILVGSLSTTASYAHAGIGLTANLATAANTGDAASDFYSGIANLEGSGFDDTLTGDAKANVLTGGKGKDSLSGGNGKDTFAYRLASESLPGAQADTIVDFDPGTSATSVDRIDLSAIDAKSSVGGNQAFTFKGAANFTGAGQIRLKKAGANVIVQGNTGGSLAPEFEIVLKGLAGKISSITARDFKL